MMGLTPIGTAAQRLLEEVGEARESHGQPPTQTLRPIDPDDCESVYFGWEMARCAPGLPVREQRALAALAAACIAALRAGSTRLPLEGSAFAAALASVGGE